jgi:hypothetical protein
MHFWLTLLIFLTYTLHPLLQNQVEINNLGVDYQFGQTITFHAWITSQNPVKEVFIFINPDGQETRVEKANLDNLGQADYSIDLSQKPLQPFTQVVYWFRANLPDGSQVESNKANFIYEDNRFIWQKLEEDGFQVNWVEGDLSFGQAALNTAKGAKASATKYLPETLPQPLKVYIYPHPIDLQKALQLGQFPWIAGHASTALGTILVSIPPGSDQQLEMERQIPHELMHILEYQASPEAYQRLPTWLTEGMASLAEVYPNPDYQRSLTKATENNALIQIKLLCTGFSREASSAFLSYAESNSFVGFLYQKYGSSGLQNLMKKYQDGLGCEEGVLSAFGVPLDQLEYRWKQEALGINVNLLAWKNLSPYLFLSLLLLIPPLALSFRRKS